MRPITTYLALILTACSGSSPTPPPPPVTTTPATPPSERPDDELEWLMGHWVGGDGARAETWAHIDGVGVGVGFGAGEGRTRAFEVMLLHQTGAGLTYTAMPGGLRQVDFPRRDHGQRRVVFANPAHDHPQQIVYQRDGEDLRVELSGGGEPLTFSFRAAAAVPAPTLFDADVAFDADTHARGGIAWAERFETTGANHSYGGPRTEGRDAVAAMIDDARKRGIELRWAPEASALSPAGDMGFTAGPYRVERDGEVMSRGVYVTVWRRGADGRWYIPFDTGVSAAPKPPDPPPASEERVGHRPGRTP